MKELDSMYMADDGSMFTNEDSYVFYKKQLNLFDEANVMLECGSSLFDVLDHCNLINPRFLSQDVQAMLEQSNCDTLITAEHVAGYPVDVNIKGEIGLGERRNHRAHGYVSVEWLINSAELD